VNREVIRPLEVWNLDRRSEAILPPGAVLLECRILRNWAPGAEPYVVEFQSSGYRYTCPLFQFQPRTQSHVAMWESGASAQAVAVLK